MSCWSLSQDVNYIYCHETWQIEITWLSEKWSKNVTFFNELISGEYSFNEVKHHLVSRHAQFSRGRYLRDISMPCRVNLCLGCTEISSPFLLILEILDISRSMRDVIQTRTNLYIRIEVLIFGSSRIEWRKNTYFSPFFANLATWESDLVKYWAMFPRNDCQINHSCWVRHKVLPQIIQC